MQKLRLDIRYPLFLVCPLLALLLLTACDQQAREAEKASEKFPLNSHIDIFDNNSIKVTDVSNVKSVSGYDSFGVYRRFWTHAPDNVDHKYKFTNTSCTVDDQPAECGRSAVSNQLAITSLNKSDGKTSENHKVQMQFEVDGVVKAQGGIKQVVWDFVGPRTRSSIDGLYVSLLIPVADALKLKRAGTNVNFEAYFVEYGQENKAKYYKCPSERCSKEYYKSWFSEEGRLHIKYTGPIGPRESLAVKVWWDSAT
ncbi:hypothetical protein OAO01_09585 [Oligoflexia bacterium]|nr:hypothetical protein [Oligoflexia bacterium]